MEQSSSSELLPYELGPYRLEKTLGQGGMGIVYEAFDRRLDRRVAIKRLLRGHDDPRWRGRLRREARTTAQLDHPSIVQIFDLIEDDAGDWIVMERLHGRPLAEVLEAGPLEVGTTLNYVRQVVRGLASAHALEVVHRDLKTENVMILPDGRVKILDFGIAKLVSLGKEGPTEDLSKTGMIIGTGRAMSPEQARGLKVGPRSDLFSLGVLLYECLTGVSPFRGKTPVDTLARIVSHHPDPVEELAHEVPPDLAKLVARLLRKAPELRPANAEEVEASLSRLIEARRPPPLEPTGPGSGEPWTDVGDGPMEQPSVDLKDGAAAPQPPPTIPAPPGRDRRLLALGGLIGLVVLWAALRPNLGDGTGPPTSRPAIEVPSLRYEETLHSLVRLETKETPDRAIEVFRGMIESDPKSSPAHAGLARAYWQKARSASAGGDPIFLEQALAMAQEAVRLNSYLADARANLGLVLATLGRYEEASENLDLALELDPKHADAHYAHGHLSESRGHLEEALAHFRRAGEIKPAPVYWNAFGAVLYDLGRYKEAEQAFEESLAVAPGDLHALRNLGALYHADGRLDDAAAMLQKALKIRPDASLFSNLGTVLFSRGLYSQSARAFEDALAMDGASNQFIYWLNLADAYRQLPERSDQTERCYRRGIHMLGSLIESRPADIRLRSRRALALARLGEFESAREDIAFVRREGTGGDLYSLFRMAVAEELTGDRERAIQHLSKALSSGFSISDVRLEPDLVELRADPRFHHLLVGLEEKM